MADTTLEGASGSEKRPSALRFLQRHMREYGILIAFIVIVAFFTIATDGILLRPLNVTKIIEQQSYVVIMAVGMLMVIVCGHIDLSVGSVLGFIGALAATMITVWDMNIFVAGVLCIAMGAVIGMAQGFWIAYFKIPSFIVTLAGMLVFKGLTLALLDGQSVSLPTEFKKVTTSFIPDIPGGLGMSLLGPDGVGLHSFKRFNLVALLVGLIVAAAVAFFSIRGRQQAAKRGMLDEPFPVFAIKTGMICFAIVYLGFLMAGWKGLPNVLIIMALIIGLYSFVTQRTTVGRRIYAIGGNEKAAKLSGINSERLTFLTFANMGVLAAIGGLIYAARLGVATPKAGFALELDVIAAVFIGGASMAGGVGTVVGAVTGALIMGVMNNGMSLLGINIDWQQVIKGLVLLAAVIFDVLNKNKS